MAAGSALPPPRHFLVGRPSEYVAHVETNRPAKLNAFFEDMWVELGAIFGRLSRDPDVRAVVLSGAGDRAFSAGLDIEQAAGALQAGAGDSGGDGARRAVQLRRFVAEFQDCISAVEACEKRMSSHAHLITCLPTCLIIPTYLTTYLPASRSITYLA